MTEHSHPSAQGEEPLPWDLDPDTDPADLSAEAPAKAGPRERHDAFTDARKCVFLKALMKSGCILDACRATGVSAKTVYRHQENDPRFATNCRTAQKMSATPLELTAWSRAVEGVEREFACGGQVYTRRIYSDSLLRLLLQGSNPKKYGQRPGFTRKQLAKAERKRIEREVRAETAARTTCTEAEAFTALERELDALDSRTWKEEQAAGWTKTPDGHRLPPGYGWVGLPEGWAPPPAMPPGNAM